MNEQKWLTIEELDAMTRTVNATHDPHVPFNSPIHDTLRRLLVESRRLIEAGHAVSKECLAWHL